MTSALPLVAAVLAGLAVLVVSGAVISRARTAGVRRSLAWVVASGGPARAERPDPATATSVLAGWGAVSARLVLPGNARRLRLSLAKAGRPATADFDRVAGQKSALALVFLAAGLPLAVRGPLGVAVMAVLGLVGYFVPDVLVYNAGLRRSDEIRYSLPDALDLLDLCVESGLSLQAALARVASSQPGPVAAEFGRVLKEMQLGKSRAQAFASLASRTTQPDLARFVAAVQQVDRLGIPVAAVLREQSTEMRAKRHARAREQAQKVPVKILAPLMLCFLPGLFIIILGPAAVNAFLYFTR